MTELLQEKHVDGWSDERNTDGIWFVYLKQGYCFTDVHCGEHHHEICSHCRAAKTKKELKTFEVIPCDCERCNTDGVWM